MDENYNAFSSQTLHYSDKADSTSCQKASHHRIVVYFNQIAHPKCFVPLSVF